MARGMFFALSVALTVAAAAPALADTSCRGGHSFAAWLQEFRRDAARQGITERALAALDGIA